MKCVAIFALLFAFASANRGKINCGDRPCPMIYAPVCGTDGVTYSNECVFENALCGIPSSKAMKVAHQGACKTKRAVPKRNSKILCEKPCPMIYAPVCGTNGVTYSNACDFENSLCGVPSRRAHKIDYEGPCIAVPSKGKLNCQSACPFIYMPVCGTNGVTYANECTFEASLCGIPAKKAWRIEYQGPCKN